jgi:hypothetical protein
VQVIHEVADEQNVLTLQDSAHEFDEKEKTDEPESDASGFAAHD